jgi:hypothetical protein
MNFLEAPLVCGIVFFFIYMIFELFARKNERIRLIEKMGQSITPMDSSLLKSQFSTLLPSFDKKSFSSLRIGCLFVGLGLGLLVGLFLCLNFRHIENDWERETFKSVCYGASVLLFGGLGLIISYIIESRSSKKDEK